MEWYEELTGMTKEKILAEMEKPRNEWSIVILRFAVSVLLADKDTQFFFDGVLGNDYIGMYYRQIKQENIRKSNITA